MKKFLALLLAMMMMLSLVACGSDEQGDSDPSDVEVSDPVGESGEEASGLTDMNGDPVSQETITALTQAYNAIAVQYNKIATAINENGWMADEQTVAEVNAVNSTIGFVGAALNDDISMLDGTDFEKLITMLESELPPALSELAERVSVPYGG